MVSKVSQFVKDQAKTIMLYLKPTALHLWLLFITRKTFFLISYTCTKSAVLFYVEKHIINIYVAIDISFLTVNDLFSSIPVG